MSKYIKHWDPDKLVARVRSNLKENMAEVVDFVVWEAQFRAPVRTGKLREAIKGEVFVLANGDVEGIVGVSPGENRSSVARWIELGTSKMPATPFLRPAVFENEAEILRIIQTGR